VESSSALLDCATNQTVLPNRLSNQTKPLRNWNSNQAQNTVRMFISGSQQRYERPAVRRHRMRRQLLAQSSNQKRMKVKRCQTVPNGAQTVLVAQCSNSAESDPAPLVSPSPAKLNRMIWCSTSQHRRCGGDIPASFVQSL
jgi:hypothetical protein